MKDDARKGFRIYFRGRFDRICDSLYVRAKFFPFTAWGDGYWWSVRWVQLEKGVNLGEEIHSPVLITLFSLMSVINWLDKSGVEVENWIVGIVW